MEKNINDSIDRPTERTPEKTDKKAQTKPKVVQDSQSAYNEAQQTPMGSGDKRHPSGEQSVQLPWGIPTDDQHPVTQPGGDRTQSNAEVGAPPLRNQQMTRMQNEESEQEFEGDTGRSDEGEDERPGRMQDRTSVRPKDDEAA
jgi:hypothetical protein